MAVSLAANALTTKELVKSDLGISVATYDDTICWIINAASALIESKMGRSLQYAAVVAEPVAGKGSELLSVARYPIDATKTITITHDGSTIDSTSYEIHDAAAGLIRSLDGAWSWDAEGAGNIGQDALPGTERKLYAVSYSGGYVLPASPTTRTLPEDIELACRILAAHLYRQLGRDHSVTSEKLLSTSVTYAVGQGFEIPAIASAIIDSYRRIV